MLENRSALFAKTAVKGVNMLLYFHNVWRAPSLTRHTRTPWYTHKNKHQLIHAKAYFITFYTGIFGLAFFQFFSVDYTYPEAFSRLLERRQRYMYERTEDFDYLQWKDLTQKIERKRLQIQMLRLPRMDEGVAAWDPYKRC